MNWLSWQLFTHECCWCLLRATVGSQLKADYFQCSLVKKNDAVFDYKAVKGAVWSSRKKCLYDTKYCIEKAVLLYINSKEFKDQQEKRDSFLFFWQFLAKENM